MQAAKELKKRTLKLFLSCLNYTIDLDFLHSYPAVVSVEVRGWTRISTLKPNLNLEKFKVLSIFFNQKEKGGLNYTIDTEYS